MMQFPSEAFEFTSESEAETDHEQAEEYRMRGGSRAYRGSAAPRSSRYGSGYAARPGTNRGARRNAPPRRDGRNWPQPPRQRPYPRPVGRAWPMWPISFTEPPSALAGTQATEHTRWLQSSLNQVMGLQLPVNGIMNRTTRDAIRDFQRRQGLPADGYLGPDTERALIDARRSAAAPGGSPPADGASVTPGDGTPPPDSDGALPGGGAGQPTSSPTSAVRPGQPPQSELFETGGWGQAGVRRAGLSSAVRRRQESLAVQTAIRQGQRDPNKLTNLVFIQRHPELGGRKLRADEAVLVGEWKAILRDIVLPQLRSSGKGPAAVATVGDRAVGETLRMAATKVPGLGISLEELLVRHQAESGGIPIEVLLAFIHFEAGNRLFADATAGKWNARYKQYSPRFYELGVFQTPAGDHGCTQVGGRKQCQYPPPGRNVERSSFGQGWHRFTNTHLTADNWKDPTLQVRIGLWNLRTPGERIAKEFPALFSSRQSEWYLRMAVLYSFAVGAGWTRAFLRKYGKQLLGLPESQRWDFLRDKEAFLTGYGTRKFQNENVDKKMALAAKIRAVRGG